ncbi:Clan CA, family C54, ATG4-like cysteine peptidase [Tritrichomonas foetus]|uniref:Cysteine protease n=1 Tax=Tritrichomonas foetus TaxID=1144522 RepID=A0A1J4K583_9EUKA|nr:Clan CA, family C54, ATG4-like cysteine peptidase [Tritrichomonas foetus]|eukprot:OHT06355.1 Clan CA, family C54, ATG4-like cysteine peptidase [Tritrichomonas foetus]
MSNFFRILFTKPDQLTEPYRKIPRFTYRTNFEEIPNTKISSDSGWGCCYRCCQSIAGNYLRILMSLDPKSILENDKLPKEENILLFFKDCLSAPFSLQNLVQETIQFNDKPGTWAQPSHVASAMKNLFQKHSLSCEVNLNVPVDFNLIDNLRFPCLYMFSLRLGLDKFEYKDYSEFLKAVFTFDETIGLISGRSGSAFYIVKIDDNGDVFYFDPHVTQSAMVESGHVLTLFNQQIMKMKMKNLNQSILLCFACKNNEETKTMFLKLSKLPNSPIAIGETVFDVEI